jgi:hypothetical protein
MPALNFILTTAGKNAIINANNTGTNPVVIDRVAIGSTSWTPTAAATALQTEIKKISAVGGGAVADDTIHVTATDSTTDVYTVREVGLYTSGNVLLAVYSQTDPIIVKGAGTVALIAADLVITGIPAGSVTVGDTTFSYPQATETVKGVAELATTAETLAGTDDERIVTPAKLAARTATETRTGIVELATEAEVQTGTDTARSVTPAGLASRTATTTRTGVVELATDAEVQTGTDDTRAVTPGGLNACTATETRRGVIELATAAEVQTGTDTTRAVTPATLNACTATATRSGVIELATQTETDAGTDTERAITPEKLRLYPGAARAWVVFDGEGTVNIINSFKVSSVTDLGTGQYRINWNDAFGSSSYCWVGGARQYNDTDDAAVVSPRNSQAKLTASLSISIVEGSALRDCPEVCVAAFA